MRLINVHTLEISTFADSEVPLYAALSHRWGRDEVEYHEFTDASARNKAGFAKIQNVCREVRDWSWSFKRRPPHGHTEQHRCERVHWVWIDTCCIDKRNFTEYAEAITSMWAWYKSAAFCIVYLRDVKQYKLRRDTLTAVRDSEWFERGWTLQELLAPRTLFFYSNNWKQVGSSAESDLMETISRASGIPARCMGNRGVKMKDISVAKRMSWASGRKTTKPEDLACCLLGMFEVYMPLMYGEGFRVAFQRLQRTIIECYDDESIFAFTPQSGQDGVLATNLRDFANCGNVIKCTRQQRLAYSISNRGLQFNATAIDVGSTIGSRRPRRRYAIDLNCAKQVSGDTKPVMCTLGLKRKGSRFIRDPEIERVFEAVSKAGVERRLNRGTWEWIPSQWFYIHVSKSGRSRRQREIVEEPDTVSGIFSKAIDWLSSHYPLEAFGLRPRPLDHTIADPGRNLTHGQGKDILGKPHGHPDIPSQYTAKVSAVSFCSPGAQIPVPVY
ncbi:hypothetical protein PRZ48_013493 [Zasmidium cellare]|uniref:Heterokaryon incompatibility domain-containing protein n=1 Tax=Zasmidium cellare TaxID=395010 RepID=A0ABR0E162_ZASCE|nr:hypothetical protein PRZ48_013493 [Zasmidium cellare]